MQIPLTLGYPYKLTQFIATRHQTTPYFHIVFKDALQQLCLTLLSGGIKHNSGI
tara:strand:- start:47 stop:208 length:162 start_codon:yes stop_codon:yes gene_type:complete